MALAALDQAQVGGLTLAPHPSLAVVASPWDLALAWRAWREERPSPAPEAAAPGSAILVARLDGEVFHRPLLPWQSRLYAAWMAGAALEAAVVAAGTGTGEVEGELTFLLRHGLCVGFAVPPVPILGEPS